MGDWTLYAKDTPVRSGLTRLEIEGGETGELNEAGDPVVILGLLEMNANNPDVYALGPGGERLP